MSSLADLFPNAGSPVAVEGIVARTPGSQTELLAVTVPSFDDEQPWRLRWMPRGDDLPTAGDRCLVIFTQDGTEWCAAWWPS